MKKFLSVSNIQLKKQTCRFPASSESFCGLLASQIISKRLTIKEGEARNRIYSAGLVNDVFLNLPCTSIRRYQGLFFSNIKKELLFYQKLALWVETKMSFTKRDDLR